MNNFEIINRENEFLLKFGLKNSDYRNNSCTLCGESWGAHAELVCNINTTYYDLSNTLTKKGITFEEWVDKAIKLRPEIIPYLQDEKLDNYINHINDDEITVIMYRMGYR